ncbi:MAG: hypothetical protein INF92_16480 [Rhodobacter sp.]|nr:hypothetical protein [Rhodobacter sp.]
MIAEALCKAFRGKAGLHRECARGRNPGFTGLSPDHPEKPAGATAAFAPDDDGPPVIRRQAKDADLARTTAQGVAMVAGKIVETLHIVTARALLARVGAIAAAAAQ